MKNTWIELDLAIFGDNLRSIRAALAPGVELILVVKSNAYGHGMALVARRAWSCGAKWFAVAHVDEALALRELLPNATILILGPIDPADAAPAIENDLIPIVVSEKHTLSLLSAAVLSRNSRARLHCHAKIDTGMGRLGFPWENAAVVLPELARNPKLDIKGLCTHLASSGAADKTFARIQIARFRDMAAECEKKGMTAMFKHVSNSGGILSDTAWDFDAARPGILLYGYAKTTQTRSDADGKRIETKPFLQWKTRVVQVKEVQAGFPVSYDSAYLTAERTHIATLNVGYADGYPRLLSNNGFVIIHGRRRPVVGTVTMNFTMADLGLNNDVLEGDEATLLGSEGNEAVWADEIAEWCGTISYEILTGIKTDDRRVLQT